MNLGNRLPRTKIILGYMQPSELFHSQNVSEYCKSREQQIELEIQGLPHSDILSSDRETMYTRLVNTYLSDKSTDYPVLDMDNAELLRNSDLETITILQEIPWTGSEGFFSFKPVREYDPPSPEVTIHLDQVKKKVSLYYELSLHDPDRSLEERVQTLLEHDIAWVVNSLDDVIRCFRDHDARLMSMMSKALEERVAAVYAIEGIMERVEVSKKLFRGKLSTISDPSTSRERHPRYDVFKPLIFGFQRGQCNGTKLEIHYKEATVDHIIPKAAGGGDELDNLQVLCGPCNSLKGEGRQDAYLSKIDGDPSICAGSRECRE